MSLRISFLSFRCQNALSHPLGQWIMDFLQPTGRLRCANIVQTNTPRTSFFPNSKAYWQMKTMEAKRLPAFPDRSGVRSDLTFRFGQQTVQRSVLPFMACCRRLHRVVKLILSIWQFSLHLGRKEFLLAPMDH